MKLSEYAAKHGIQYRAAWNRFKAGKIPGAWQDESGTIIVPDETQARLNDAAVYARVSDPSNARPNCPRSRSAWRIGPSPMDIGWSRPCPRSVLG